MTTNAWLDSFSSTRRQIIVTLKKRGEASAAELAASLFVTVSAIRQHLSRLTGEGLVQYREVGRGPGRRRRLYSLSGAGDHLFPSGYEEMTTALRVYLDERVPGLFSDFLESRRVLLEQRVAPRVAGRPLATQASEVARVFARNNFLPEVAQKDEDIAELTFYHCPVFALARDVPMVCQVEAETVQGLVPEHDVERTSWRLHEAPVCTYRIGRGPD